MSTNLGRAAKEKAKQEEEIKKRGGKLPLVATPFTPEANIRAQFPLLPAPTPIQNEGFIGKKSTAQRRKEAIERDDLRQAHSGVITTTRTNTNYEPRTYTPSNWHPNLPRLAAKKYQPKNGRIVAISPWVGQSCIERIRMTGAEVLEIKGTTPLDVLEKCCGLLIPGGRDVSPSFYGAQPDKRTQAGDFNRDSFEIALVKFALQKDMPILGICRGHQVLNVAMGGTLIQDMHHAYKHPVSINPASKHLNYIGDEIYVNSLHHQAIDRLGKGLIVTAQSPDGTVEAVESVKHTFVVGVQWHPEMDLTPRFDRTMNTLWTKFVNARQMEVVA